MDLQSLVNELNAGGFRIEAQGEGVTVVGPIERLTAELKQGVRQHKQVLHTLACIPYEQAEREAIRWADTKAADEALSQALADWDELTNPPPNCPQCGELPTWWDAWGIPRCRECDSNRSGEVRALAKRCRDNAQKRFRYPNQ
jgi:hypothetical protein